jgi:hypothetical protein
MQRQQQWQKTKSKAARLAPAHRANTARKGGRYNGNCENNSKSHGKDNGKMQRQQRRQKQ